MQYNPANHVKGTEKFSDDSVNNLIVINARSDDTSPGIIYLDSGSFYFTIDSATNLPVSYTLVFKKSNSIGTILPRLFKLNMLTVCFLTTEIW